MHSAVYSRPVALPSELLLLHSALTHLQYGPPVPQPLLAADADPPLLPGVDVQLPPIPSAVVPLTLVVLFLFLVAVLILINAGVLVLPFLLTPASRAQLLPAVFPALPGAQPLLPVDVAAPLLQCAPALSVTVFAALVFVRFLPEGFHQLSRL